MEISIRRANDRDAVRVTELLHQVLDIHAKIRPDIFLAGTTKYSRDELSEIFRDDLRPVFVAVDENDRTVGYAFCIMKEQSGINLVHCKTLYIDDLCVDSSCRGSHIGRKLYDYVIDYARKSGCSNVTLNVWEGNNSARAFYEKQGMKVRSTQMETIIEKN